MRLVEQLVLATVGGVVGALTWSEIRRRGRWLCVIRHQRATGRFLQPVAGGPVFKYCARCGTRLEETELPGAPHHTRQEAP